LLCPRIEPLKVDVSHIRMVSNREVHVLAPGFPMAQHF
jgi:hypothetical protein